MRQGDRPDAAAGPEDAARTAMLRRVLDEVPGVVFAKDLQGRLLEANRGTAELIGMAPADFIGLTDAEFLEDKVQAAAVMANDRRIMDSGRSEVIEEAVSRPDGSPALWLSTKAPLRDETGAVVGLVGTSVDITERKAVEAALERSRLQLKGITDSIDQIIFSTGPDGVADYYNQRWYDVTGAPPGSTAGVWAEMIHPDDLPAAQAVWRASLQTGEPVRHEYRLRSRQGGYGWVLARAQAVRDETGAIARWFGTCTDIEDIVLAREVLARSRAELETLVARRTAERDRLWDTSPDLLLVIDFDGVFREVNAAWTAVLGYQREELVGTRFDRLVHAEDLVRSEAGLRTATHREMPIVENRYRHKDGSYRWIQWKAAPAQDAIYATGRHVTAEKETAEALRQSQKMEAVGQLTGGIAHDFNNMLAVVIGSLDLLTRRIGVEDARARRYVDAAAEGARRAAALTQRLLAFSRQQPLRPETLDANALVAGISDLLRHSLGGEVRLETVLAGGLWRVHADPNQLENVILNLTVNARDAMGGGGRVTIETQNAHLDERYSAAHLGVPAGQYVMIAVTDTGGGMTPEVMAKAFDPFFTTKEVGKGTGLGLSQVYGFAKQSGGHVKIYSEARPGPGQGTTVKVYLPRHLGAETLDAAPQDSGDLWLGEPQEVVLVVEDEPAVRRFSVEALTELGYRVLEADGAAAALRLLDAHPDIALMFTDVVMPEVNGARLAEEARRRRPDLRILFTTGYTRNAVVHNGVLDPGVELIGKPFTLEALAAKVREVLDGAD